MKALIFLSLTIVSLNVFAGEVGEDKSAICAASPQSNRGPKVVVSTESSEQSKVQSTKATAK